MEVRDPTTGRSAFYIYTGANVGTPNPQPISVGIPDTGYTDLDLPPGYGSVDIEDFNGAGSVQSVAMGPRTGGLVSFLGPKLHHQRGWSRQNGVVVFMDGWSVQLIPGASAGMGYWKRAPYSTAAERARYVQRFSRHLERVERGPKY